MNKFNKSILKIWIVAILIFGIFHYNNDYIKSYNDKYVVLDKINTIGGYMGSTNFYLVLERSDKYVFDTTVSPARFSQVNIGDTINLKLRKIDMNQTMYENIIYVFIYSLVFSFLIAMTLVVIINTIINLFKEDE